MKSIALGQDEREVLTKTAELVRSLGAERDAMATRIEEFERFEKAAAVVTTLERKGLSDTSIPFMDKVASLLKSGKDLDVVKEAADMSAHNVGLGELTDRSNSSEPSNSEEALLDYLTS